jgi:DNA polymerase lambda
MYIILKVRTVNLFGEVWGVGPATALKLYDKGYRTLDDLQKDDSLTYAQRIGLKFFDDIKQRIPRHEVCRMRTFLLLVASSVPCNSAHTTFYAYLGQ